MASAGHPATGNKGTYCCMEHHLWMDGWMDGYTDGWIGFLNRHIVHAVELHICILVCLRRAFFVLFCFFTIFLSFVQGGALVCFVCTGCLEHCCIVPHQVPGKIHNCQMERNIFFPSFGDPFRAVRSNCTGRPLTGKSTNFEPVQLFVQENIPTTEPGLS